MFKNWKTTLSGLVAVATGVKIILTSADFATGISVIASGIGLLFAKDAKTGDKQNG